MVTSEFHVEKTFSVFSVEVVLIRNEFHLLLPNESSTDYSKQMQRLMTKEVVKSGLDSEASLYLSRVLLTLGKKKPLFFYLFVGERAAAKALNFLLKNV